MKICDVTQSYAPTGGGVRTYIHAKRDLIERGGGEHRHVMIVPGAEDGVETGDHTITYTVKSPLIPGSRVYRLLHRSRRVLRILRAEQPDVIESHCAYNLPWTALHHRKQVPSTAVVGVYMTDLPKAYVEPVATRAMGRWLGARATDAAERYVRSLYGRMDATVAISPVLAERLTGLGLERVHCVPLGVDLDVFDPARRSAALRSELGVEGDAPLLVYAGRLDGEKRAAVVLDAFERLPERLGAHLVLVGDGPMREELARRADAHGRAKVVPFLSDRVALATLLASSDLYVSAMPYETFGLSVIEAQACGLPVVGVSGGAMVDRVPADAGVGLLGAVDSADEMAANIVEMLEGGERQAAGLRARRLVEERFSWSATFDRMFELYETVLDRRRV